MQQSDHELAFWKSLFSQHSTPEAYRAFRVAEYKFKVGKFPGFEKQAGLGLDLGSGLVSVLDNSPKDLIACDPLMDKYLEIVPQKFLKKTHIQVDGEDMGFQAERFDWILCNNVIDHTPHPEKMADEILRVLKTGGKLYFEVNFDDHLSPAHFGIWDTKIVDDTFKKFKQDWVLIERNQSYPQSLFYAIYTKPKN